MFLDIILVISGAFFLLAGLIGCIIPVIPGPPLGYVALLLLQFTRFADFSVTFLIVTAVITIAVTVVDYVVPTWMVKKWGGSRAGIIGSAVGLLIGLFFMPLGIVVGPFAGAVIGELIANREGNVAFRSGLAAFAGFVFGTLMKLTLCLVFVYYFVRELVI